MLARSWITALAVSLVSLTAVAEEKAGPVPPHWTQLPPVGQARVDFTATLLQDLSTLIVGGAASTSGGGLASCELYDPGLNEWTAIAPLHHPRFGHTATRLKDGRVVVVGGWAEFGAPLESSVEIYDPASGAWTEAAPIPVARVYHTAVLLQDGRLFVAGGDYPGPGDTTSAYIYHPQRNVWRSAGDMSVGREPGRFGAIVLPDGDVLVAGGYLVTTGGSVGAADRYDVATGTWTTLPNLAEGRNGNTLDLLPDGRVLVTGGKNGGAVRSSTEIFDPATNTWSAGPSLGVGRWGHTTVNIGRGHLLAVGGRASTGDTASVELFDFTQLRWLPFPSLHVRHFRVGTTVTTELAWVGDTLRKVKRVLAISGNDGSAATNVVEETVIPDGWVPAEPN